MIQNNKGKIKTQPVFIVGMPRTGSKIYKNIINFNSDINISPEIFFLTPKWIRKDFINTCKELIGEFKTKKDIKRLADLMFDNRFFGTYWRDIKGDKEVMVRYLEATDYSYKEIFEALLKYDANLNNKKTIGAKFPVHIINANILQEWFPEAKFVHLNRHPLAIYNSQKRKHLKDRKGIIQKIKIKLQVFLATIISYRASYAFNKINAKNLNYALFEYEKLTSNPEEQIKRLCKFLSISFKPEMLNPPVKDSSYKLGDQKIGIHKESSLRWKKEVNYLEKLIFQLFTKTSFSK